RLPDLLCLGIGRAADLLGLLLSLGQEGLRLTLGTVLLVLSGRAGLAAHLLGLGLTGGLQFPRSTFGGHLAFGDLLLRLGPRTGQLPLQARPFLAVLGFGDACDAGRLA